MIVVIDLFIIFRIHSLIRLLVFYFIHGQLSFTMHQIPNPAQAMPSHLHLRAPQNSNFTISERFDLYRIEFKTTFDSIGRIPAFGVFVSQTKRLNTSNPRVPSQELVQSRSGAYALAIITRSFRFGGFYWWREVLQLWAGRQRSYRWQDRGSR